MTTIIIEDERPAAEKLKKIISAYDNTIRVDAILDSVQSATAWLARNPSPEMIFMDIELSDGLSFKIFESFAINCPVIFTTAYDEYWQRALELNGIDYLLKPIRQEKFEAAMNKYMKLKNHFLLNAVSLKQLSSDPQQHGPRKRLLLKKGIDFISLSAEDIAYCYAAHKLVFIVDNKSQRFILDRSLQDLERELDPVAFFRINRKYLVNICAIKRVTTRAKSRLSVELNPVVNEEIVVSQESTMPFKKWMDT